MKNEKHEDWLEGHRWDRRGSAIGSARGRGGPGEAASTATIDSISERAGNTRNTVGLAMRRRPAKRVPAAKPGSAHALYSK